MNQILDYSPNKNSVKKSSKSDNIVRVFAVILIIFAISLLGMGAFGIYKQRTQVTSSDNATTQTPEVTKAKITIDVQTDVVKVKVSHDKVIEKAMYNWNEDKEREIKGNGSSTLEFDVELPAGTNDLCIKVVDSDGVESSYEEQITSDVGKDIIAPSLDASIEKNKVKIHATDETEISYVTYRWNKEDEQKVEVKDETGKIIDFEIDVLEGTNDLTIVAVDASQMTATKNITITGIYKPQIKITVSPDKKTAYVEVTHDKGVKEIQVKRNGEELNMGPIEGENTNCSFEVEIKDKNTTLLITAIGIDDTKTEVTEEINQDEEEQHEQNPEEQGQSTEEPQSEEQEQPTEEHESPSTDDLNQNINISIQKSSERQETASIKINYEAGIKQIIINVNGMDQEIPSSYIDRPEVEFELDLAEGSNNIKVTVVGSDETKNEKIEELTR